MADAPDGFSIAGIVGGLTVAVSGLWTGIKWLVRRADQRGAALDRKEEALVAKLEQRVTALEDETRTLWMAISYVVPALHRHAPDDPALRMAAKILGDKFPIDPVIPPDMLATLGKI